VLVGKERPVFKLLSITAVAIMSVLSTANAEQWYIMTPGGKCSSGSEMDAAMDFPLARTKLSVASPEDAQHLFQVLGDYRGMEQLDAAYPDGAVVVKGRFPGGIKDIKILYIRDLEKCQTLAAR
jgi:hypothetical protein